MNVANDSAKSLFNSILVSGVVLVAVLMAKPSFADTSDKLKDSLISVKGSSELYIPADLAHIAFSAIAYGKTAKEAEHNGYTMGIKLKNILKKYGVQEEMLENYQHENPVKEKSFLFSMNYSFFLKGFNVIDTLRQELVESGVSSFKIAELASSKIAQYDAKVRQLAYQNARQQAQDILKGSGLKLGAPLYIGANPDRYRYVDNNVEGLGTIATGNENLIKRQPLLQQKQLLLKAEIEVNFRVLN